MRDVLPQLLAWCRAGHTVGMATVVSTWRSAPRPPGAVLLVGPDGLVVGSVSGGCVESDVVALAEQVVVDGRPALRRYGVTDADATAVGLPCGGELEVYVEAVSAPAHADLEDVAEDVAAGRGVAVATVLRHPDEARRGRREIVRPVGSTGTGAGAAATADLDGPTGGQADARIVNDVRDLLASGHSGLLSYGADGQPGDGITVFAAVLAPLPRMLVFGAGDYAAAVARLGRFLGYRVTVCDARGRFATADRFPDADEVVVDWPHRYLAAEAAAGRTGLDTVLCVLTHDLKFDLPLLEVALRLPVGYVGAMGSRSSHEERVRRLRAAGVSGEALARLASPIGLDLGALTPEETAVSVAAEIVGSRRGGRGRPLREGSGPIHA